MLPRIAIAAIATATALACSDSTGPTPIPPVPTIADWTPENPYWDDVLIINGTGFSAEAADNTVWFTGHNCPCPDTAFAAVMAASPTQLTVRMPSTHPAYQYHPFGVINLRVSGAAVITSTPIFFLAFPQIFGAEITPFAIDARLRPGTTFKVDAEGLRPGASLSVNGISVPVDSLQLAPLTSISRTSIVHATMPPGIFGPLSGEGLNDEFMVTLRVMSDGRDVSRSWPSYRNPATRFIGITGTTSFSLATLADPATPAQNKVIRITGEYMAGPALIRWTAGGGGLVYLSSVPALDWVDEFEVGVPYDNLPAGGYNVAVLLTAFDPNNPMVFNVGTITLSP
jgi:hypothetical protein